MYLFYLLIKWATAIVSKFSELLDYFYITKILKFMIFKTIAMLFSIALACVIYSVIYNLSIPNMYQKVELYFQKKNGLSQNQFAVYFMQNRENKLQCDFQENTIYTEFGLDRYQICNLYMHNKKSDFLLE